MYFFLFPPNDIHFSLRKHHGHGERPSEPQGYDFHPTDRHHRRDFRAGTPVLSSHNIIHASSLGSGLGSIGRPRDDPSPSLYYDSDD